MTHLITLCYSFSTSLCPPTGSLQAAYAALEHTTLSGGGLYLPIKPKALNQVFESPHHAFLLVGSLGPHSSDCHCQLLSPGAVFPGGNCWEHQVTEVKEITNNRKKSQPSLVKWWYSKDYCRYVFFKQEPWILPTGQAQCSELGHSGEDQPVPAPLGAHNLMGSSGFPKNHWSPRTDVHDQGIQLFPSPPLHPECGSFQVPQGRNQCRKPHLHWLQAKRTPGMKPSRVHIPAVRLINYITLST